MLMQFILRNPTGPALVEAHYSLSSRYHMPEPASIDLTINRTVEWKRGQRNGDNPCFSVPFCLPESPAVRRMSVLLAPQLLPRESHPRPSREPCVTNWIDPEFAQFARRRQRLNERLEASRQQLDAWMLEHSEQTPSMLALGTLEGLLKTRRDMLAELVSLDEQFMDHLIEMKRESSSETPDASQT